MKDDAKQLIELFLHLQGSDISKFEDSFLRKSLQKRIVETKCKSVNAYLLILEQQQEERTIFLNSLQINYSEFFRNPLTFAVLERIVLPSLILNKTKTKQKEIRIWSAACASGQDAYSLAILLEELGPIGGHNIKYQIFANDQSEHQIRLANRGHFSAQALQGLTLKRINRWFTRNDDCYTVKQELKKNINFSVFDLFNQKYICPPESIFGDFDLVFCANLLFYYKSEYRKLILDKTGNALSKSGFLISGEAEREILFNQNFQEVFLQSAIFRK